MSFYLLPENESERIKFAKTLVCVVKCISNRLIIINICSNLVEQSRENAGYCIIFLKENETMKKLLIFILAFSMIMAFSGCGGLKAEMRLLL